MGSGFESLAPHRQDIRNHDATGTDQLAHWYRPHIEEWSRLATAATTLWFWNTEVGWATVHPLLAEHGWEYVQAITWDKGIRHVAGNVNGQTIRKFPIATEICVFYQRQLEVPGPDGPMPVQRWVPLCTARSGARTPCAWPPPGSRRCTLTRSRLSSCTAYSTPSPIRAT
jgi:hypothetical protein